MSHIPPLHERLRPTEVRAPVTAPDDARVGQVLGSELADGERPRCVLIGFPTDVGVRRNGGRAGAAEGPRAIREFLYRLTANDGSRLSSLLAHTRDLGDVITSEMLDDDQRVLGDIIAPHILHETFIIVLGGGHETAFGHYLGHARSVSPVRILNWDAHTDVRSRVAAGGHSGSPFRQAIEHAGLAPTRYSVAGLQPHAVASAHEKWVVAHEGRCVWRNEIGVQAIRPLYESEKPTMVSFDLDAVDQAFAPGVSAPSTGGLSVAEWLAAAEAAGQSPGVRSCDVVELSPPLDRDGQTARLAALTVWHVLRGLAGRRERRPEARA